MSKFRNDFENDNVLEAREENARKTLSRLEKTKAKLEKCTINIGDSFLNIFSDVEKPVKENLFWNGHIIEAGAISGAISTAVAVLSVPVVTALTAIPTVAKDIINLRIKLLQKKLSVPGIMRPSEEITKRQENRVENATKEYNRLVDNGSKSDIKLAKRNMEKEKHIQDVYQKATNLAKVDSKEKTIQRLMNVAASHESRPLEYAFYTAIQTGAGITMQLLGSEILGPKVSPYFKAAAVLSFAAAGYEAVKTITAIGLAIKEKIKAKKAFRILEKYTKDR